MMNPQAFNPNPTSAEVDPQMTQKISEIFKRYMSGKNNPNFMIPPEAMNLEIAQALAMKNRMVPPTQLQHQKSLEDTGKTLAKVIQGLQMRVMGERG